MRTTALAVLVAGLVIAQTDRALSTTGNVAQGRLDNAVVEEALQLGREGDPKPYTLHMNAAGTGAAGAVYTPFVRIAIASSTAHKQGRDLTATELPDWLTEPVVYIALRWYCVDSDCAFPSQPIAVTIGPFHQPYQNAPSWVSRDFSVLGRFGATPSPDTIAVAGFPMSAIKPNVMVMTCVWTNPDHCDGRGGVITQKDIAAWR